MARHTRRLPRTRQERDRANERAARLLDQLQQQAHEVRELETTTREAKARLHRQILKHIDARDLDISDMAKTTGISRQTIHRLVRARQPRRSTPVAEWTAGQRVVHESWGAGTIETADGPNLLIRFDSGEQWDMNARLAGIKPL